MTVWPLFYLELKTSKVVSLAHRHRANRHSWYMGNKESILMTALTPQSAQKTLMTLKGVGICPIRKQAILCCRHK
jgi:hypothetical protein